MDWRQEGFGPACLLHLCDKGRCPLPQFTTGAAGGSLLCSGEREDALSFAFGRLTCDPVPKAVLSRMGRLHVGTSG
jgi:hypothetical protein